MPETRPIPKDRIVSPALVPACGETVADTSAAISPAPDANPLRPVSHAELAQHAAGTDCWIALYGLVLAVDPKTLAEHPGGARSILEYAGRDATEAFEDAGHSDAAREWCNRLKKVGRLVPPLGRGEAEGPHGGEVETGGNSRVWDWVPMAKALRTETLLGGTTRKEFSGSAEHPVSPDGGAARAPLLRMKRLFAYPIKACAGVEVSSLEVMDTGFKGDREYVLVMEKADEHGRHMLPVPRELGALALISPCLPEADSITIALKNDGVAREVLLARGAQFRACPNKSSCKEDEQHRRWFADATLPLPESIVVPKTFPTAAAASNENDSATLQRPAGAGTIREVFFLDKWMYSGVDQGDVVADYLSAFLARCYGKNFSSTKENVLPEDALRVRLLLFCSREIADPQKHTADYANPKGANYSPFMFFTEPTLRFLNQAYTDQGRPEPAGVTLKRFRPNILFGCQEDSLNSRGTSLPAFVEDSWCGLEDVLDPCLQLEVVKACGRCSHIYVDPSGGGVNGAFIAPVLRAAGRDAVSMAENEKMLRERPVFEKYVNIGKTNKLFCGMCAKVGDLGATKIGGRSFRVGQLWRPIVIAPGEQSIVGLERFLSPATRSEKKRVRVVSVQDVSHDTKRIRFDFFGQRSKTLGLPCGNHIKVHAENFGFGRERWNGVDQSSFEKMTASICRAVTPTETSVPGCFDVVLKMYRPLSSPGGAFPDGGRLTGCLDHLCVNETIAISGPFGHIEYLGRGLFRLGGETKQFSRVLMIAAGSGITPMLQVLKAVRGECATSSIAGGGAGPPQLRLLYANKTSDDILCSAELTGCCVETTHILSREQTVSCRMMNALVDDEETGAVGAASSHRAHGGRAHGEEKTSFLQNRRLDADLLRTLLRGDSTTCALGEDRGAGAVVPRGDHLALLCGPDGFVTAIQEALASQDIGWKTENIAVF